MAESAVNPQTGVIDNPQYPCYKADGLCKVRFTPPEEGKVFACAQDPSWCKYLKRNKIKKEVNHETS